MKLPRAKGQLLLFIANKVLLSGKFPQSAALCVVIVRGSPPRFSLPLDHSLQAVSLVQVLVLL